MSIPQQGAMTDENLCAIFDAYIKVVLKNKSRNAVRSYRRRMKHEVFVPDIDQYENMAIQTEMGTCIDKNTIHIAGATCVIDNDVLYYALCQLKQHYLVPLLLKYWLLWQDEDSAAYCGITMNAIRKRRQSALAQLRLVLRRQGRIICGIESIGNSQGTAGRSRSNSNADGVL